VIDYESLSNEDLTMLLCEKCPQAFFPVTGYNRHPAIALIEIALEGAEPNSQMVLASTLNDKNQYWLVLVTSYHAPIHMDTQSSFWDNE
jgi:hypothetical protein